MKHLARTVWVLALLAPLTFSSCGGGAADNEIPPEEDPALMDDEVGNPSADP